MHERISAEMQRKRAALVAEVFFKPWTKQEPEVV
jgi:hypothetical protein